ncbi:MAG: hypothetical protein AAFV53_29825, partial [Myxococcota bacterium]
WLLHNTGQNDEALKHIRHALAEQRELSSPVAFTAACCLLVSQDFAAAVSYARDFLGDGSFTASKWDAVLHFFQLCANRGDAPDAVRLIDELQGERWLPVRVALLAADKQNPDILLSVAPEFCEAARPLYERFITPWKPLNVDL